MSNRSGAAGRADVVVVGPKPSELCVGMRLLVWLYRVYRYHLVMVNQVMVEAGMVKEGR